MTYSVILCCFAFSLGYAGENSNGAQEYIVRDNLSRSSELPNGITQQDFDLFVRVYQDSVAAAKAEPLAIETPINRKNLELFRAREKFREIATQHSLSNDTAQILINLIKFDIIGDYLNGLYSEKVAYQLLLEQSSPTNLSLEDFLTLSVTFYKQVSGGDFNDQFADRINKLALHIKKINGFIDEVISMSDEQLDALQSPKRWREANELFDKLGVKLYTLQYRDSIKRIRSDETRDAIKKLVDRFQIELIPSSDNVKYWDMKLVRLANGVHAQENFYNWLKKIYSDDIPPKDRINVVHGSRSSSLLGLAQTAAMLIPTGILGLQSIIPLSGELNAGATKFGVNRENISGNPIDRFQSSWNNYGTYQANNSREPLENYINDRSRYTNIDGKNYSIQEIAGRLNFKVYDPRPTEDYEAYSPTGAISIFNINAPERTVISRIESRLYTRDCLGLPHKIKQLRLLDPEKFEPLKDKLLADLKSELEMLEAYKKTDYLLVADEKLKNSYSIQKSSIKRSIEAIETPIAPLDDTEKDMVINSFPIIFASNSVWDQNLLSGEYTHAGPLALGDGISHIIVNSENVEFMREWLKKHVIRESLPQVMSLDDFYAQYPEAKKQS